MAYGYTVKNNKKSTWIVDSISGESKGKTLAQFNTKREALDFMLGDRLSMVLTRKRTWLEKDDELRAFNTTQNEYDELIMWDADKGLMLEKGDGWMEWNVSKKLHPLL